ncbi:MAG: hypothetical protein AB7V18_10650 [Pyrinomonadaceae bacterium]
MKNRRTARWLAAAALVLSCLFWTPGSISAQALSRDREADATLEFKRLRSLQATLEKIPLEKQEKEPHKSFLRKNDKLIVYSEPAGQWYVRSELFWDLHSKYRTLPIAEEIAWAGAQNPLPGECEGYVNCYVFILTETSGRYLRLYPNGKYSTQAVREIIERIEPLAAEDTQYDLPAEISDRSELRKLISELQEDLAVVTHPEKEKALALLKKLAEAIK